MKFYFLTMTPRSGSTLLHSLLESTGVAGYNTEFRHKKPWNRGDFRCTSNGWRSVRVSAKYIEFIPEWEIDSCPHIRVVRKDKIAQAISLGLAIKSNRWTQKKSDPQPSDFTELTTIEIIEHLKGTMLEEKILDDLYEKISIQSYTVYYEDLVVPENRVEIISNILSFLRIDVPKNLNVDTYLVKQATDHSDKIKEQFLYNLGRNI